MAEGQQRKNKEEKNPKKKPVPTSRFALGTDCCEQLQSAA